MEYLGNKFKRCVYVYEFSNNVAYVGLTFNMNSREQQHKKRGPVFQHSKLTQNIKEQIENAKKLAKIFGGK